MPITDFLQGALPIASGLAGGPVGAAIGSAAAAGIGGIDAAQKKKAYQAAENGIPMVDPVQQAYLARVQQQERNMRAGTDVSSALSRRLMENNLAQTQTNLLRANGPNAANNLLRSQAAGAGQGAQIGGMASQAANQLLSFQGGLIDHMADRVYTRQKQRRDQSLQDYQTAKQDANARIGAVVGMLPQAGITGLFNNPKRLGSPTPPMTGDWRTQGIGAYPLPQALTPNNYTMNMPMDNYQAPILSQNTNGQIPVF